MTTDPRELIRRLFEKDPSLWKGDSESDQKIIRNSLGWLDLAERMRPHLSELREFGEDSRREFDTVVLLGMGGSSLCPEVYGRVFGRLHGWPRLVVLDSVVPEAVRDVERSIEIERSLFIVASKSGSTIEPMSLYKRFRGLLEQQGLEAGNHFVAITDPGSPLEAMSGEAAFRKTFLNFPDVGGRYSALSLFGMVPAALAGYDIDELLARANRAMSECGPDVRIHENRAFQLGLIAANAALGGIDKLTLVLPERLSSFGLWIEQLVAESTGKEGKGIIPIAGEPPLPVEEYGTDRLFALTRWEGKRSWVDELIGIQPTAELEVRDDYDLGWLFVVWELATAFAGVFLGINPFDQPDVEEAKRQAKRALTSPPATPPSSLDDVLGLVDTLRQTDYFALLTYGAETTERNGTIGRIREKIALSRGVATTAGYGPRYLHSTGQLHKGGPGSGVFVILTQRDDTEMAVPGESFTLNRLALAQAAGDHRALEGAGRRAVHLHVDSIDQTLALLAERLG